MLAGQLVQVHEVLAVTLAVFVLLHVLAALQHHFIYGDRTLRRMLAWRGPRLQEKIR